MILFSEKNSQTKLPKLKDKEKSLVLVIHDESIFNVNDGKKKGIEREKKSSL